MVKERARSREGACPLSICRSVDRPAQIRGARAAPITGIAHLFRTRAPVGSLAFPNIVQSLFRDLESGAHGRLANSVFTGRSTGTPESAFFTRQEPLIGSAHLSRHTAKLFEFVPGTLVSRDMTVFGTFWEISQKFLRTLLRGRQFPHLARRSGGSQRRNSIVMSDANYRLLTPR